MEHWLIGPGPGPLIQVQPTFEGATLRAVVLWVVGMVVLALLMAAIRYRKTLYRWLFWPVALISAWVVPFLLGQAVVEGRLPW